MAKPKSSFICQACGSQHSRWQGQCPDCSEWNQMVQEAAVTAFAQKHDLASGGRALDLHSLSGDEPVPGRLSTGIREFDSALGGGLVAGSVSLIGGDPGIGKSTLLLQVAGKLAMAGRNVAYVSGEEAVAQIRLRAGRLGYADAPVTLTSATSVRDILTTFGAGTAGGGAPPDLLVIDSIQTMHSDLIEGAPGTVSQVRASAQELIRFAKQRGIALILVGHVTKDGSLAGPRVLEHMVDTVLAFEGERSHQYRILRSVKNRFGGTDEIGVFAMGAGGLEEVSNPSALFLTDRHGESAAGTAVFPAMEGTRPVLVEIQALTLRLSSGATPRRAVVGWDASRLAMILAVLEARCGLSLSSAEVYLNVAGGYRLTDPAADLAVAAAIVSAFAERPLPAEAVVFGEIALSGELRPVAHAALRMKEAAKLGFTHAIVPSAGATSFSGLSHPHPRRPDGGKGKQETGAAANMRVETHARLGQCVDQLLGRG
ncbi:MAG: DNA repair protein RadA [Sphingopyxis sp.]